MVMNGHAQTGVAFAASVAVYQANRIPTHKRKPQSATTY